MSFALLNSLLGKESAEGISLSGSTDITILQDPSEYYSTIRHAICEDVAKHSITFSALYFGNGAMEGALMQDLDEAMSRNMALQVKFIVDYSRAQRSDDSMHDSLTVLKEKYAERFQVYLYQMPHLRSYNTLLPKQICEIMGVYHVKFNLFDDQMLMLSGANLSEEYFRDRQDRYMVLRQEDEKGKGKDDKGKKNVFSFIKTFSEITIHRCHAMRAEGGFSPPALDSSVEEDDKRMREELVTLIGQNSAEMGVQESDTVLYPCVQHGNIDLYQESQLMLGFLHRLKTYFQQWQSSQNKEKDTIPALSQGANITIASPYPSFRQSLFDVLSHLRQSSMNVTMITASKESHGFSNTTGVKALIPQMHEELFRRGYSLLMNGREGREEKKGQSNDGGAVDMLAYHRDDWTFHCKGIWSSIDQETLLTYVGSSNMGERSYHRDMELGFVLVTKNATLKQQMHKERDRILKYCHRREGLPTTALSKPQTAQSTRFIKLLTRAIRSYL